MTGKDRMAICLVIIAVPLGILQVWATLYRPDLLLSPVTMRYIWGGSILVLLVVMVKTKTLFSGDIMGTLLVLAFGPLSILGITLYGIWHKISPLKKEK